MLGQINTVVILFPEDQTVDNFASDVKDVNGDPTLPIVPLPSPPEDFVAHDPARDHKKWIDRGSKAQAQRFARSHTPNTNGEDDS